MNNRKMLVSCIKNTLEILQAIDKTTMPRQDVSALAASINMGILTLHMSDIDDDEFDELYTYEDFYMMIEQLNETTH